jgi:predicted HAD superfamily Cof-like phosphohydrolase
MTTEAQKKVEEFHRKHGFAIGSLAMAPKMPAEIRLQRSRLVAEEAAELVAALHENDTEKVADAIGDLLYVTLGTAVTYGIPSGAIFDEVHASNMTKERMNAHGKAGKGKDFVPPRILQILMSFGFLSRAR